MFDVCARFFAARTIKKDLIILALLYFFLSVTEKSQHR